MVPLTISCPNCSSRYVLPEHLLGPAGARVCCPGCWHRFALDAAGAVIPEEPAAPVVIAVPAVSVPADGEWHAPTHDIDPETAMRAPAAHGADPVTAAAMEEGAVNGSAGDVPRAPAHPRQAEEKERSYELAARALSGLEPHAEAIGRAAAAQRFFSEFGPRLLEAFDRYRIAGGTSTAAFVRAARERLGVDLTCGAD